MNVIEFLNILLLCALWMIFAILFWNLGYQLGKSFLRWWKHH